jgi:hypothetical protein
MASRRWNASKPVQGEQPFVTANVRQNWLAIEDRLLGGTIAAQAVPDLTVVAAPLIFLGRDGRTRIVYAGSTSGSVPVPVSNPHIAVLTVDDAGVLAWTAGAEAASPAPPAYPLGRVPLGEVFCRPGMTRVFDADDGIDGYILRLITMVRPVTRTVQAVYMTTFANLSVDAGVTVYVGFGDPFSSITEDGVHALCPIAGLFRDLYVRTRTAQPGTGSLVITFRKNAADQALTLSIPAGAAAGLFSDLTHGVAVVPGDMITLKLTNNASTDAATLDGYGYVLEAPG